MTVTFTDMPFNAPNTREWDFGGWQKSAVQNSSHTFMTPGTYTISLTVKNSLGGNTTSRRVYVR
mgnify:CR=1 FL=1